MFPFAHDRDRPAHPLSDEQAMAQVIDPAKQIARVAGLQDVSGGFSWESCNDQGDPPYRGRVDMTFNVPAGIDHNAYYEQIAKTMVAHGWSAGAPSGKHLFGTVIRKEGVWADIGISPFLGADGAVQLFGECRNMNNHRHDSNGFSIEDQLRAG
ncbi:hypothetical protein AWC15_17975 [Mycobacterium lacus]|uniref:Uncharacterized protein n=2 Tax=Mycobacterium lacus TaxID=169765 RepID=A0A1X1YE58_9MYCO|nr:hypothetical protein [Mycobacterium lacus]ORW09315.1 hypothetical protein AWC15_17975 [Mycobacterium lacus]BBX96781.1 hypothetical protein MLAC_20750 [Mycobacterium lacus]